MRRLDRKILNISSQIVQITSYKANGEVEYFKQFYEKPGLGKEILGLFRIRESIRRYKA